ncbi:MAG: hypothetical protein US98_C0037G0003 [Parcubacteria group bacterium GW2011_GWC1_38_6]|nr:MAG: hypothetical protein US98_C0037G0003 [Parcubacteria group bacterium GW2011_GWC1_38_6]
MTVITVSIGFLPLFGFSKDNGSNTAPNRPSIEEIRAELDGKLLFSQDIALNPVTSPIKPGNGTKGQLKVVVTAYSSTPWETDNDPFITASGSLVRDGIIANNYLPFGTLVRIPEIYGDKVFVVKDRMNSKKGDYHIDIWLPSNREAKNFGVKRTYIEILEG